MKKLLTIAAASLMMASCGLYNKYDRPDVNTTGLFRDTVSDVDTLVTNTDERFGDLPWREVFTDPQLQALIEKALENNTDLANAALNVKMMEDMLKVAKLAMSKSFRKNRHRVMQWVTLLMFSLPPTSSTILAADSL